MRLFVTGGAGFIGSAFIRLTVATDPATEVLNFDALTYAGNLENLASISQEARYVFVKGDLCSFDRVDQAVSRFRPDAIVHFAAESHVDRSILSPRPVVDTNLGGTFNLIEAARRHQVERFLHVSTDEVYGSIAEPACADESFPLNPSSPYSASKAGSDLLALSYFATYKLPVIVTRASNNYGPFQFPEKLIPLMISNAMEDQPLPIYGDGMQVRDWLYVDDHCRALQALLARGRPGEIYNIGGNCALPNRDVVRRILSAASKPESLMTEVEDRPGHDRRYALTSEKTSRETGWTPQVEFDEGLARTMAWYRENRGWVSHVRSGEYKNYYDRNYGRREEELRRLSNEHAV